MIVFDGRGLARRMEDKLKKERSLAGKSLLILQSDVGQGESRYVQLKREMGERLGVTVRVELCGDSAVLMRKLIELRDNFDGVMVQLPVTNCLRVDEEVILREIPANKDVDGLNPDGSDYYPAVAVAISKTLQEIRKVLGELPNRGVIVGSKGIFGSRVKKCIESEGVVLDGIDKGDSLEKVREYDLIISATGVSDLIKGKMVKKGVVAIDIGYPYGDFDFESMIAKASLLTPVPGGVGPVTIVSLFENLARV